MVSTFYSFVGGSESWLARGVCWFWGLLLGVGVMLNYCLLWSVLMVYFLGLRVSI
jgi:hypothetical protein